jgi:hypothetical protein
MLRQLLAMVRMASVSTSCAHSSTPHPRRREKPAELSMLALLSPAMHAPQSRLCVGPLTVRMRPHVQGPVRHQRQRQRWIRGNRCRRCRLCRPQRSLRTSRACSAAVAVRSALRLPRTLRARQARQREGAAWTRLPGQSLRGTRAQRARSRRRVLRRTSWMRGVRAGLRLLF